MNLPEFPWDSLAEFKAIASAHVAGAVDLSIGAPVDPTPEQIQAALRGTADAHTYPTVAGIESLREAILSWWSRTRGATLCDAEIMPTIGSKELVANLPLHLGLDESARVGFPECAYPTYDIGARLIGAESVALSRDVTDWPEDLTLVWLNSPGNPDGSVLSEDKLREIVAWARQNNVILVSDECYAPLDWRCDRAVNEAASLPVSHTPSLLADTVTGGDHRGLLAAYSLSKQSNMAGYRAAFVSGDAELIARMTLVRRHAGFMIPAPVQAAMTVALNDDEHVAHQREIYRVRRQNLLAAIYGCGLANEPDSVAGLYLWVKDPRGVLSGWDLVAEFARRGIIVVPGDFYGSAAREHVRISLTATDERIAQAVSRLMSEPLV